MAFVLSHFSWDVRTTMPSSGSLCTTTPAKYPEEKIPKDPEVIETICYTRLVEDIMIGILNKEHKYELEVLGKASTVYLAILLESFL